MDLLSNDKILALSKLKAFADDNFNVAKMAKTFPKGENIVNGTDTPFSIST